MTIQYKQKGSSRGYLGNVELKGKGVDISWTPAMVDEFMKCANDPIYFSQNYIKIVHVDRGLIPIDLYDYQREILSTIFKERRMAVCTSRQAGKALSLDTEIPMSDGSWSTMGKLVVGDKIIGSDGHPTTVVSKSIIHNKPTYKIVFEGEGHSVRACEDHLWQVFDRTDRSIKIIDTKTIAASYSKINKRGYTENRYAVLNTKPVVYKHQDLLIDPYVLGAWLGDGGTHSGKFTCSSAHVEHFVSQGIKFNNELSYERNSNSTVFTNTIIGLHTLLKQEGLFGNKRIPSQYLIGSIEQRTRLLQGLMDTDGFVEKNGTCQIQLSVKTEQLIDDVGHLLNGLGFKWTKSYFASTNSIRISFSTSHEHIVPVTIPHKLTRIKSTLTRDRYVFSRSIVSVELIDIIPTQCITVDSPDHMFLFGKSYIPTHNTTTAVCLILHYILFNDHKTVALLANKGDAAREILDRIKIAYQALPLWLQQGVVEWNKGSVEFENGCKIIAAATSSSAIRGKSISLLYIDETAFVEDWDRFFASVFPTISSGQTTKILLTSTPNGLNHFFKTCEGAKTGSNGYHFLEVQWYDVPGRDEAWKQETLAAMDWDYEKFDQEFCCAFLGSSGTLISGSKLKQLVSRTPTNQSKDGLKMYHPAIKDHVYVITVDVSRGKGLDFSAFQVIDTSVMPYIQVCTFRSNSITPYDYSKIVYEMAVVYNRAHVLVELNDIGEMVSETLYHDFDYENILATTNNGRAGKKLTTAFRSKADPGLRTTKTTKISGCSLLKLLVEQDQLLINDWHTIQELSTFSKKGHSYEAEAGCHDDLVMCLVIFAWAAEQTFFKELTDINTLHKLRDLDDEQVYESLIPFGLIQTGHEEHQEDEIYVVVGDDNSWLK